MTLLYCGSRTPDGRAEVVDEDDVPLDPRLDLVAHASTGFEFGYGGAGPAQLGLAILADAVGDELALQYHALFTCSKIALLPRDDYWILTVSMVRDWMRQTLAVHGSEDLPHRRLGEPAPRLSRQKITYSA